MPDIFALQDEIVQSLVATIGVQLSLLGKGILVWQRTKNLAAYDYLLRGLEDGSTLTPEGWEHSRKMFEKAVELDPGYSDAYGSLSFSYFIGYIYQYDKDPSALSHAAEMANRTIVQDNLNPLAFAVRGWTEALQGQRDKAVADAERAVSIYPNFAFAWFARADIDNIADQPAEDQLACAQKAMRLDPRHPDLYFSQEGWAYARMGRYREAVDALKKGDQINPYVHLWLVCAYSELGKKRQAQAEAAEVLRASPGFSLEEMARRLPTLWGKPRNQWCVADLRKAGLN